MLTSTRSVSPKAKLGVDPSREWLHNGSSCDRSGARNTAW